MSSASPPHLLISGFAPAEAPKVARGRGRLVSEGHQRGGKIFFSGAKNVCPLSILAFIPQNVFEKDVLR